MIILVGFAMIRVAVIVSGIPRQNLHELCGNALWTELEQQAAVSSGRHVAGRYPDDAVAAGPAHRAIVLVDVGTVETPKGRRGVGADRDLDGIERPELIP